ncbi:GntR family transcriptional regulator [Rothia endophytica]|uniref:GntR family transcriptional regulator n=1 Tax=Rothia endophytica TaxID=1324766 RepID=UPI001F011436|nr:GntR family transcriptional regulator [Rothia endophytica]
MKITLKDSSPLPVYQQIHDAVVRGIATGQLAPGSKLLSVRAIAKELGINPATVVKAYDLLKEEGLIESKQRGQTTVAYTPESFEPAPASAWDEALMQVLALGKAQGRSNQEIVDAVQGQLIWLETQREASRV